MIKKNASLPGFIIGHFIGTADGLPVTTGTPTCKRLLDGVAGTLTNAASYDATAGVWKIDLAAADLNADFVGLVFTLATCLPISYGIRTSTKLVSDLVDAAAAPAAATVASAVRAELTTEMGRIDAATSSRATQASVDDVPTNTELATALGAADDATLAAIANVWDVVTQAMEEAQSAMTGTSLVIRRGDTYTHTFTALGDISARTKFWVTIKASVGQPDSDSIIQVVEGVGLLYLNGATGTAGYGSLVVTDEITGVAIFTIAAEATVQFEIQHGLLYDLQAKTPTRIDTVRWGEATVIADVTRAII